MDPVAELRELVRSRGEGLRAHRQLVDDLRELVVAFEGRLDPPPTHRERHLALVSSESEQEVRPVRQVA